MRYKGWHRYVPGIASSETTASLVERAREGDADAFDKLKGSCLKLLWALTNRVWAYGLDRADFYSYGWIAVLKVIKIYDPSRGASWEHMLRLAIKAEFSTLLEAKNTNKERVNHYTVDDLVRERKRDFSDELIELTDYDSNPEDIVIASWGKEQAYERFKELCSELEWEVFQMWMFDQHHWGAYREIAERLGITEKAVDNAMIRIRRKAEKVAEEAENGTL